MNILKSHLIYLVTFLICVSGCSQMVSQDGATGLNNDSSYSQDQFASGAEEENLDFNKDDSLNSAVLLNSKLDGFSIIEEMDINEDRYLFTLKSESPLLEVIKLSNPPRLVVDILGSNIKSSEEIVTADSSSVSKIRVGNHSSKVRVVLDLKSEESLNQQRVESIGKDVLVTIPVVDNIKTERLALLSSQLGSRAQLSSEDPSLFQEENKNDSNLSELANSSDENINLDNKDLITLTSIKFTKTANTPGEVSLSLTAPIAFDLSQTAQSEFVLSLPGVVPDQSVLAPLISAKGKEGIRSVRVLREDNSTKVRLFVDSGINLSAFPKNKEIVIKTVSTIASKNSSSRAQLADKEVKSDENIAKANPTGLRSADGSKVYTGRLISLDLQDTDIDNALRIIAEVSNLNIIASEDVSGKVTLRLMDVPWDQALDVILKTNGLDQVTEGNVIRIAPVDKLRQEREALREAKRAAENLEDLTVKYIRISYARAEDVKDKVEAVISERGSVTADERTNQLIIKDIQSGLKEAIDLLAKLDLRTPQILLETQIVEGSRSILRDLGFQWNFSHIQSPATGNATGINFPNTVNIGGGTADQNGAPWAVNFPSIIGSEAGSAVTAILDSADGSRVVAARLSALEQEGKAKIVSRPQVATINNKQAKISSVTTIRVRTPNAGTSIATGSGATSAAGGMMAFQAFNVGIELDVTPQASPDFYVLMDVEATSSSFSPRDSVDGIPATIERKATSSILVKSGQTFALGGVYRIEDSDGLNGVPFLKDIPFIGAAFRQSLVKKSDEELIFFITPHIVEGSFDDQVM